MLISNSINSIGGFEHTFGTREGPLSQDGMATVRQVHSAICLEPVRAGLAGEGDALITRQPGLAVSVRTADCLPILLADPVRRAAAAVHAGWRGTAAGIVGETIGRMRRDFGTDPADLWAAIGPGIGACCYEVGDDVARRFGREGNVRLDLAGINRAQLMQSGVAAERIERMELCTRCDAARFHSYRRDGERAGRMISYIRVIG